MIKQDLTARMDEACKGCDEGKGEGRARELLNFQAQANVCVNTPSKTPRFLKNLIWKRLRDGDEGEADEWGWAAGWMGAREGEGWKGKWKRQVTENKWAEEEELKIMPWMRQGRADR